MNHCSTLILVPTVVELEHLSFAKSKNVEVQLCGFGLAISGIRTAQLIKELRPSRAVLIGIAGGYGEACEIGSAHVFSSVTCYGIGVGEGNAFQSAEEMGWSQWPGSASSPSISDIIKLRKKAAGNFHHFLSPGMELLSCATTSHNLEEANRRHSKHPKAAAEDMESYAVAAACNLLNIPLSIVRGISNQAGNRDMNEWQIPQAMTSASSLAQDVLNEW